MGKIVISANRPKRQSAANQKFHRLEQKASTIAAKSGVWSSYVEEPPQAGVIGFRANVRSGICIVVYAWVLSSGKYVSGLRLMKILNRIGYW